MADDDSRTAVEQDPEGGAARLPEGDGQDPGDAQDTVDWKAEARKWERQAKSNMEAAKKLADIEESQKTEQQKLADRLTAAETRAAEAELKALRAEVASVKGIPGELAPLLQGSTREELETVADALLKHLPANGKTRTPPVDAVAGTGTGSAGVNGSNSGGREPRDVFASLMKGG